MIGGADRPQSLPWLGDGIAQSLGEIPLVAATTAGVVVIAPDLVPGRAALTAARPAAWMPSVFAPPGVSVPVGASPLAQLTVQPVRAPWRLDHRRLYPSFVAPPPPVVPARGPTVAATITIEVELGAQVTYEWRSDVTRSYNGTETRRALSTVPRETYDFATYLDDVAIQTLLSRLVVQAAGARAFAVALEHESLPFVLSGGGATVPTLAFCDWAYPGQSVAVVSNGNVVVTGVVQGTAGTTIILDVALGTTKGRIMPTIPCYLDDQQSLGLYPANAGSYSLKARAVYFGAPNGAWPAHGATVHTYVDPLTTLTYPVYDVPLPVRDSSPRAAVAGTTMADFGGVLVLTGRQASVDFMRQILHVIRTDADRQYLKAFAGAVLGRTKVFLLPTWRPDLIPFSDASTGTMIVGGGAGGNDYAGQWFLSPAQQRLQLLKDDGTVEYVRVFDAADLLNGTQELLFDRAVFGNIVQVSFLETCRLESDSIVVQYNGAGIGTATVPCRVVLR